MKNVSTDLTEFLKLGGKIKKIPTEFAQEHETIHVRYSIPEQTQLQSDEFEDKQVITEVYSLKRRIK